MDNQNEIFSLSPSERKQYLLEQINAFLTMPLNQFPIERDVPRLLPNMKLVQYPLPDLSMDPTSTDERSRAQFLYRFLQELSKSIDYEHQTEDLVEGCGFFILNEHPNNDLMGSLQNLLHSEFVDPDMNSMLILRTCNQNIIGTAFTMLKHGLGQIPFGIVSNSWRIDVSVFEGLCNITHLIKGEVKEVDTDETNFSFQWEFGIVLDLETRLCTDVHYNILFAEYDPELLNKTLQTAYRNSMALHIGHDVPFQENERPVLRMGAKKLIPVAKKEQVLSTSDPEINEEFCLKGSNEHEFSLTDSYHECKRQHDLWNTTRNMSIAKTHSLEAQMFRIKKELEEIESFQEEDHVYENRVNMVDSMIINPTANPSLLSSTHYNFAIARRFLPRFRQYVRGSTFVRDTCSPVPDWVNMFFDIFILALFSRLLTKTLTYLATTGINLDDIYAFVFLTLSIWLTWTGFHMTFNVVYANTETIIAMALIVTFFLFGMNVDVKSIFNELVLDEETALPAAFVFAVARFLIMFVYLILSCSHRRFAFHSRLLFFLSLFPLAGYVLILVHAFLPDRIPLDVRYLWIIAVSLTFLTETAAVFRLISKCARPTLSPVVNVPSLITRFNTIVMLSIGISIYRAASEICGDDQCISQYLPTLAYFFSMFFFAWLYFNMGSSSQYVHALRRSWFFSTLWVTVHFPLIICILASGEAVKYMLIYDSSSMCKIFLGSCCGIILSFVIITLVHRPIYSSFIWTFLKVVFRSAAGATICLLIFPQYLEIVLNFLTITRHDFILVLTAMVCFALGFIEWLLTKLQRCIRRRKADRRNKRKKNNNAPPTSRSSTYGSSRSNSYHYQQQQQQQQQHHHHHHRQNNKYDAIDEEEEMDYTNNNSSEATPLLHSS